MKIDNSDENWLKSMTIDEKSTEIDDNRYSQFSWWSIFIDSRY